MTTLLRMQKLGLRFGSAPGLSDVDLQLEAGERLALVGANGSGKSTLLRVMHGLLQPGQGDMQRQPNLRCAMLFQRPHMLRTTVRNNLALGLWLQGKTWRQARLAAEQVLQRFGLGDRAERNARTLSGGLQQKLAIARAWIQQPDLLLLDEPTASLDPHAKGEIEALIGAWTAGTIGSAAATEKTGSSEPGRSVQRPPLALVFASHNLGQVKRLASRVIYLERGRICADLAVEDFFNAQRMRHSHPEAHLFLQGELG